MPWREIARFILSIIGPQLAEIAARLLGISIQLDTAAIESQRYRIQGDVEASRLALVDGYSGNYAIRQAIAELRAYITTQDSGLLAAIGAIPAPPTPPTALANADAVWAYAIADEYGYTTRNALQTAYAIADNQRGWSSAPMRSAPGFVLSWMTSLGAWQYAQVPAAPAPSWADLVPGESRFQWLQRTDAVLYWQVDANGEPYGQTAGDAHPDTYKVTMSMSEAEFQLLARAQRGTGTAPIWPGLANVTLGTPVALTSDLTVDGPLDGLIVSITTPPTGLGKFTFGGFTAYYKVGEVSFVSDNGEAEPWQYLAFDQALYCPKAMSRAASASLRVLAGAAGTATPWVVT
jgi:hypothetical protein